MEMKEIEHILKSRLVRKSKKDRKTFKDTDKIIGYFYNENASTPEIFQENELYVYSVGLFGKITTYHPSIKENLEEVE